MPAFKVLLVEDNLERCKEIEGYLHSAGSEFDVAAAHTFDQALEALSTDGFDAYLVSRDLPNDMGLEIVSETSSRGLKGPALVLASEEDHQEESDAVHLGAMIYLHRDHLNERLLDRMIRHAIERKRFEDKIKHDKEGLTQRVFDLQDTSERYEAQSAQYVQMAEDLAVVQAELRTALDEVTASKQELEKLNMEKDRFFSIISHDLRSPFTALLGYTGMMAMAADKMPKDKFIENAAVVNESALRVYALLENLLEWARLQMDKIPSEPKKLEMHDLVRKTVEVLGPVGADKGVEVLNKTPEGLYAFADEHMISTVIRNLINNAIKFTPEGGSVAVKVQEKDGACEIQIVDTGVGMTPEQMEKMFSIGEKNSTKGTSGEPGTGLGLLLCKDFLDQSNGSIEIDSTPGEGSVFTITLPTSG